MENKTQAIKSIQDAMNDTESIMEVVALYSDIKSALDTAASDNIDHFIEIFEDVAREEAVNGEAE